MSAVDRDRVVEDHPVAARTGDRAGRDRLAQARRRGLEAALAVLVAGEPDPLAPQVPVPGRGDEAPGA